MIIINKFYIYIIFILTLSFNLEAGKIRGEYTTKNLKGQEYYLKMCASCHGDGSRGGNMASIREWETIFANNASELSYFHEDDEESIETIIYIKSNLFKKQSKLMLEFLQEFAYDSEHIPTCN